MKESKTHNIETNTPVAEASPELARGNDAAHVVTAGEKKFDWQTYMGIGYLANAAISVGAVYWAERTKMGHKALQSTGRSLAKLVGGGAERMTYLAKKSLLLTGGFAVLLPMKWLEDGKADRVKALNREIYGEKANTDPVILQSEQQLEEAPKQGWASLASSRALALVPFYVLTGMLWDNKSTLSRVTNPAFKGLKGQQALRELEVKSGVESFNQTASKGWFVERPIAFLSRNAGKAWAKITGNSGALENTKALEKQHPGVLHTIEADGKITGDTAATALTHITITEAVTSYVVAKSVYWLSRIMGPVFDTAKKSGQYNYQRYDHDAYRPNGAALLHEYGAREESAPLQLSEQRNEVAGLPSAEKPKTHIQTQQLQIEDSVKPIPSEAVSKT